ncbi:hypothetical protein JMF89_14855 [Clostridiaceae bacterium UIB06]|nr:hypothetical protein [Clostridiaceae bacterium UIB06]
MKKIVRGKTILTLSTGNKKLVGDENNAFLIWNLPAIKTCPYATKLCKKFCYAKKAENVYPNVLPSRSENLQDTKNDNFIEDMINTIEYYLNKRSRKDGNKMTKEKNVYFRIHESGDFYSQEYFDKWIIIARFFPEVNFLAYTKSVIFVKNSKLDIPSNFTVRFSVWDDTKEDQIQMANSLNLPIYTADQEEGLRKKVVYGGFNFCHCDCSKCKDCYNKNIEKLVVGIH